MDLIAAYVVVLCFAFFALAAPMAVALAGLRLERQPWADATVYGSMALAGIAVMALSFLDAQWYGQSGSYPAVGLLFGFAWMVSLLGFQLPVTLWVVRRRVERGWPKLLSGDRKAETSDRRRTE
jgi:hypothetical protein